MRRLTEYIKESLDKGNGDEFYTKIEDIEKELKNYDFSNKRVYCNCDNPEFSNFYKYFKKNFSRLKLKSLIATYYSNDPYMFVYNGDVDQKEQISSGKFQDNLGLLDGCDIVVTNPPYSNGMAVDFVCTMVDKKKPFIIVGPKHLCIANKEIFNHFKEGKINGGYTGINEFIRPSGNKMNAPAAWWTSFDVHHDDIALSKEFSESSYLKYDNYDAIECGTVKDIPGDYDGLIGVPYNLMKTFPRQQFDIIDFNKNLKVNGKTVSRIIIKKK